MKLIHIFSAYNYFKTKRPSRYMNTMFHIFIIDELSNILCLMKVLHYKMVLITIYYLININTMSKNISIKNNSYNNNNKRNILLFTLCDKIKEMKYTQLIHSVTQKKFFYITWIIQTCFIWQKTVFFYNICPNLLITKTFLNRCPKFKPY